MAQGTHRGNTRYKHWLRAGIALKYLREGLLPFVESTVKLQHHDMLTDMQNNGIRITGCGVCSLKTLLPLHSKDKDGRCSMGQKLCNCINPKGKTLCPTGFCSSMYDKILAQHRYSSPNWRNTDIHHWHDNHWEIAKCNISDGYTSKQSAAETDCSGLLQVIINNLALQSRLDHVIDPPNDIFSKTRKARDTIFHSPMLELDEKDANQYTEYMIDILEDKEFLRGNPVSQTAKEQLKKIKDSSFDLTWKEETAIIMEAKQAIQEEKQEAIEAIKQKQNEVIAKIEASSEEEKKAIQRLSKEAEELEKMVTSNKAACDEVTLKLTDIENRQKLLEETVKGLRNIQEEANANIKNLKSDLDSLKSHNCQDSIHNQRLKYLTSKQDLQKKLVQIYDTYHTKVSILPMIPEEKEDIGKIFVQPNCHTVGDKQHDKPIRSFKDIFYCGKKRNRKIYISGEAGIGKSTFCKNITKMWCQAFSNDAIVEKPLKIRLDSDIESQQHIVKQFHCLFFVSLKDANKFSNIAEMVKDQLLAGEDEFVLKIADEILMSDECLVILDGLDEWSPPAATSHPFMNTNVPLISPHAKSTIVTTTRPWKIITTSLTSSDMDINIEIKHDYSTLSRIADKIVGYLNQKYQRSKTSNTFMTTLLREHKFLGVEKMPILLTQLLCIWHDEGSIGHSLCDIYGNMTALFLRRLTPTEQAPGSQCLPRCLSTKCQDYQHLLVPLARLAFATLFPPHGIACISFDRDMIKQSGFTDEDIDLCLRTGILTESRLTGIYASKRLSSISFVHKTFQEFFSAMYLHCYQETETSKHLDTSEPSELLSNQQRIFAACNTLDKILENEKVFIFLSGMNPSLAFKLLEEVYVISDNSTEVTEYRVSIQDSTLTSVSRIQSLVLGCITEMSASNDSRLETNVNLADIKVYTNNESQQLNLLRIRTESIKSVFIDRSWYTLDTTVLNHELVKKLGQCKNLQKIKLCADFDEKILEKLIDNSKYTLQCFVIINQRHTNLCMTQMFNDLPKLEMIQSLELCHNKLKHNNVEELFAYLHYNSQIRELSLQHLTCYEHNKHCTATLFLNCRNLKRISLVGFNFDTIRLMAPEIEYIEFIIQERQNRLGRSLSFMSYREWPTLNTFICSLTFVQDLCYHIPHLSSLKQLELRAICFQTMQLDLNSNSKLEILRLIGCTLSHESALSIAETIMTMNHPVTMYFGKCILRTDISYHKTRHDKKQLSNQDASNEENETEVQGTKKTETKTEETGNLETVSHKEENRQKNECGSETENELVKIQQKEQTEAQEEGEYMDATNWKVSNATKATKESGAQNTGEHMDATNWEVSNATKATDEPGAQNEGEHMDATNWKESNATKATEEPGAQNEGEHMDATNCKVSNATKAKEEPGAQNEGEHMDATNWKVSNATKVKEEVGAQNEGEHMDATNWKVSNATKAKEELGKLLTSWDLEDSNMLVVFKEFNGTVLHGLFEWNPPSKIHV